MQNRTTAASPAASPLAEAIESARRLGRSLATTAAPDTRHSILGASALALALGLALLGGCGKLGGSGGPATAASGASAAAAASGASGGKASAAPLILAPEDLRTLAPSRIAQGPVITGSVQPAKRADLRGEVAAVVLQVLRDNGEAVRAGELLMRLDDTSLRDSLASADEALRAATQAQDQAERTVQRLGTLREQGMTSAQALEDAQVRRNQAQSEVAAARARVVAARQQMARTQVRAPFDGVVSERKASAGDTVQIGKELLKVIDPRSMRFEGLVSADRLQDLKLGQAASFRINGFSDRVFTGKVQRIDSSVNATTRQVAVVIGFDDAANAPRVSGLFAEGRIESGATEGLSLPEAMLVRSGDAVHVWRVDGQRIARVPVRLGERDARSGEYAVLSGLAVGDRVLRHPGSNLEEGRAVQWAQQATATATAAASAAAAASAPPAAASASKPAK